MRNRGRIRRLRLPAFVPFDEFRAHDLVQFWSCSVWSCSVWSCSVCLVPFDRLRHALRAELVEAPSL